MAPLDKELQWVNVKQKPFSQKAHSGIISHVQILFRHTQAYLKPCVIMACVELWYIHKPGTFRILVYSETPIFRMLAFS